eukprot:s1433_g10.t1
MERYHSSNPTIIECCSVSSTDVVVLALVALQLWFFRDSMTADLTASFFLVIAAIADVLIPHYVGETINEIIRAEDLIFK